MIPVPHFCYCRAFLFNGGSGALAKWRRGFPGGAFVGFREIGTIRGRVEFCCAPRHDPSGLHFFRPFPGLLPGRSVATTGTSYIEHEVRLRVIDPTNIFTGCQLGWSSSWGVECVGWYDGRDGAGEAGQGFLGI